MVVMGRDLLEEMIKKYRCIQPFNPQLLDGDGYILTVRDDTSLHYLEHKNLISNEIVFTPPSYVAHLTAKSRYGRMGLSFLNAAKVHSGFIGRLALELVNLSNERQPITIGRGDPLMHIEYLRREGRPSPYNGEYMFQYMTEEEIRTFVDIIDKNFSGLFDEAYLTRMKDDRLKT